MENTASHLDRLITTGKLDRRLAFDQGATGPIERASGVDRDLRRDHPYAAYAELPPEVAVREAGDAHARAQVRMAEVEASIALIKRALDVLPDGPGARRLQRCRPTARASAGRKRRAVRCSTPCMSVMTAGWRASRSNRRRSRTGACFPSPCTTTNMMDYAINEASFGLTIAGCDR